MPPQPPTRRRSRPPASKPARTLLVFILQASFLTKAASCNQDQRHSQDKLAQLCHDCRLAARSLEDLVRKPRQLDAYGQMSDRIDLDKIKKAVCKEIAADRERESCRSFYYNNLEAAQRWRRAAESSKTSYHDFVCIKHLKLCCPEGSFGPKCTKCARCATTNELCQGESTRSGNGTCVCKPGHSGAQCATCLPGYYADGDALKLPEFSAKRLLCKPCHRSCALCRAAGPLGCEVCARGFAWISSLGCTDVDECIQSKNKVCGPNTFCVNTIGSYFCYECDRACDGCHGDGPDMCLRCAEGYQLDRGSCAAKRKTILPPEANYYRYAIYLGLSVCTCIILHNSVYLASLVGLGVALYIGASEYVMSGQPGLESRPGVESAGPLASLSSANPALSHPGAL